MATQLIPKLIVDDADSAIVFFTRALRADVLMRIEDDGGAVVHAELTIDGSALALAQSFPSWGWNSPHHLGGSPVLVELTASDPDATAQRMVDHGATVLIPIEDRDYGKRQGRVQDPFGHLWIITGNPTRQ